jgi:hypothetical protein
MRRLRLRELSLNSVLQAIEGPLADVVLERGEYASLKVRERIYTPEEPIETVFFPTNSVLSIVSHMRDGDNIEIGTIGREGMSAFPLLLSVLQVPQMIVIAKYPETLSACPSISSG